MRIDAALIERVAAILGPHRDDNEAFWDSLDSATDVLDMMDYSIKQMREDEALVDAIKAQEADLKRRRQRIEARAESHKEAMFVMLKASGQKKVERPLATLSIRSGSVSTHIHDESSVPSQLCKITRTPDKTAIKKQIEAGEDVPGAYLVKGEDTISVRTA